ncbi:MAG: NUDIX hydrolase [Patescibacteria group bacterium]|nr:NUDIX hydrolase [Patescibacteria group bacterium]
MNNKIEWKKIKEQGYNAGYRKMLRKTFLMPNGELVDFDVLGRNKTVCIFPLTISNQVVVAKQFRPGPERVLFELPGGSCEENETPEQAAARELLEETGYKGKLVLIGESLGTAYESIVRYNFIAKECIEVAEIKPDQFEFLEPQILTLTDFRERLRKGQLTDIATGYLALDYLHLL